MKKSDFDFEGYYYNHGQEQVSVGLTIEDPHGQFWRIHLDPQTNEVTLRDPAGEVKEPDRDFLHDCTPPTPGVPIPAFPQ